MDSAARRRTALHEAGHAVASIVLGIPVEYTSIRPGRAFSGINIAVLTPPADFDLFDPDRPAVLHPPGLRADVERRIIRLMAGELAARRLDRSPPASMYTDDAAQRIARRALASLGPRIAELVTANEQRDEPSSDDQNAMDMARAFVGREGAFAYLRWLTSEAELFVARYAAAILRVADALERHAVLRGDAIAALVYPPKEGA